MKIFTSFDFQVKPLRTPTPTPTSTPPPPHVVWRRKSIHQWTLEQRTILCILDRWFSSSKDLSRAQTVRDIRKVFIAYFHNDTTESLAGLSEGAILAQLHDLWAEGPESYAWSNVFVETDFADSRQHWITTKMDLIAFAEEIDIDLIEKSFEDKLEILRKAGTCLGKRRRQRQNDAIDLHDEDRDYGDYEMTKATTTAGSYLATPPSSPEGRTSSRPDTNTTLKMRLSGIPRCSTPDNLCQSTPSPSPKRAASQVIPPIGFRGWDDNNHGSNTANGFLAGAYLYKSLDPPPDYESDLFKECAAIHLSPLPEPSSFISCAQFMLRPLHGGLHSHANPHVSIIDLHHILLPNQNQNPRLYHASDLIRKFKIQGINQKTGARYLYTGSHEYLIWGHIERESILASFSVTAFREYAASQSNTKLRDILRLSGFEAADSAREYAACLTKNKVPMDREAGEAVGHWLAWAGLGSRKLDDVAQSIAVAWRFEGARSLKQRQQKAYLEGIHAGYCSFGCQRILSGAIEILE